MADPLLQLQSVAKSFGGLAAVREVSLELAAGTLVPVLEQFNPGDVEMIHALFVGGANTPARVRVFVDFLAEQLRRSES